MPARIVRFARDHLIFREGDEGDCAYLINSGSVDISIKKDDEVILIDRLRAGQIFGELALLDGSVRSATATTETGCEVTILSRDYLTQELNRLDPFLQYWLLHAVQLNRRLLARTDPLSNRRPAVMAGAKGRYGPLPLEPTPKLIEHVWGACQKSRVFDRRLYYAGQVVFREGDPGHKAFMIRSGGIRIVKQGIGETKTLAVLGPNQLFGEFALVDDQPRSATAIATGQTELLLVDGPLFRDRIAKQSRFIRHLIRMLTDRLRDLSARVAD